MYSRTAIGIFWTLGVLAEIAMFLYMHRLLKRFSLYHVFGLSLALTSLRWFLQ